MKKQKKPGILHMLWKQCRPFMIIAPLMIVLFGTVSLVATLNPFLANTISTVLGGERRVLQSGDPNAVQYYDKTASFKQFDPGIEDFERNAQGQELSSGEQKKQAQMAAGMGAEVMITDVNLTRLRYLSEVLPKNVKTLYSSLHNIKMELPTVDLVIGSVLIPGDKAPHLITREMLKMMKPGTVLVDVAIDQGGCFETSHPTTHSEPTYVVDGIVHYAVANIPGAVPFTSTMALTNATLPYTVALACKGWKQACKDDPALALGLNVVEGKVTYKAVADVFGMRYEEIEL